jgi:uncharacterized membrane protein
MNTYQILALPGPDASESMAFGLNEKNDVVGVALERDVGVFWQANSAPFSLPPTSYSTFHALNNSGEVVGQLGEDFHTAIAVLVRDHDAHHLPLPKEAGWSAAGINDRGLVCGQAYYDVRSYVYDSHADKLMYLGEIISKDIRGIEGYYVVAINGIGMVAGYTQSNVFVFQAGGVPKLLGPGAAYDLNDLGVVCGSQQRPTETGRDEVPVTWDCAKPSPTPKEVKLPSGFTAGRAWGINRHGDVVGSCWTQSNDTSAFICSGGRSEPLDDLVSDPDWHLQIATRINDSGHVIGHGQYRGQSPVAFRLDPQVVPIDGPQGFPDEIDVDLPVSFDIVVGNVLVGGGRGWSISVKGGPPRPVEPLPKSRIQLSPAKRDALIKLVLDELAMFVADANAKQNVRTELLKGVQASVDRLVQSVAGSPAGRAEASPEMKAKMDEILTQRFGPGATPR